MLGTAVASIFQGFGLVPILSAAENVEVPLRIRRADPADRMRRVADALAAVGLADHAAQRPAELSGGQQQRVAIARALVTEPSVLLADEPTGQLDSETGAQIMALIATLVHERGTAAVVATHDPAMLARADRVLQLHDGRLSAG
jgi:putative ABC transport system ATP-binding protein